MREFSAAKRSPVKLINNQMEFHPLTDQSAVLAEARALGMTLSAFCPLGGSLVMKDAAIQQGVAAIPMTNTRENAESNFRALSFVLPGGDMPAIGARTAQHKRLISPSWMQGRWDIRVRHSYRRRAGYANS